MTSWRIRGNAACCCAGKGCIACILSAGARRADRGALAALSDKSAGWPSRSQAEVDSERLRKENEKLALGLARTKAALEVVGKAHALLEMLSESAGSGCPDSGS